MSVSVSGPVIVSDAQFMIRAALDGVGLAYILEDYVADHIARGRTRARPRGLVPTIRGVLSVLPEPTAPVTSAAGTHGGTPSLTCTGLRVLMSRLRADGRIWNVRGAPVAGLRGST